MPGDAKRKRSSALESAGVMAKLTASAAVCRRFGEPLSIEQITVDDPGEGEIRVRLEACAICHSDIHAIDGAWTDDLPVVYGHEAAGTVESVGAEVGGLTPGDRVVVTLIRTCGNCAFCLAGSPYLCSHEFSLVSQSRLTDKTGRPIRAGISVGGFADYVVVDQSQAIPIPNELALLPASLLACGVITGAGAVRNTAQVSPGQTVAIIGCGGVGLNSVQGAVLAGAELVVAVDIVDEKLEIARKFGARNVLRADGAAFVEQARALTKGLGFDHVFVTVGHLQAFEQGMALLRRGGGMVVVGMPAEGANLPLSLVGVAHNEVRVLGSKMGSSVPARDIPEFAQLYLSGQLLLDELISQTYPLSEINDAIASVKSGAALRNVIVFD